MVVLGIVLLAGAAAMITGVALSETGPSDAALWSLSVSDVSLERAFAAGLVTAVVGCVGALMLINGLRRDSRRRKARRALAEEYQRLTRHVEETTEVAASHEDDAFDVDDPAPANEPFTAEVVGAGGEVVEYNKSVEYSKPVEYSQSEYGQVEYGKQIEYGKQSWPTG